MALILNTLNEDNSKILSPITATAPDLDSLLAVPRRFYYQLHLRLIISITPMMMLLLLKLLPFNVSQLPIEGATVLAVLFLFFFLFAIFVAWRFWQPALTLTKRGIEQNLSALFTTDFVAWATIEGMMVDERNVYGRIQKMVKLVIATDDGRTREAIFAVTALHDGAEALTILRRLVPERKPSDFSHVLQRLKPLQTEKMHYRDIELTREGVVRKGETIPWDHITFIRMEGMVIAGYGSVTLGYSGKIGGSKLIIRASTNDKYLDCIKLILSKAQKASVDPGIIGMLGYPVEAARRDGYAVALIVTGFLLSLMGLIVLSFYPPTVASTWLYPLLLIPLAIAPLVWTLKLLSTRFKGGMANSSGKIIGATLFNFGPVLSVAILFSLSPASFLWLLADSSALAGRMEQAEKLYMKAEPALGKNEDFIFTLGQFYFRKGDWNRAAGYYMQSYKKDPTNWLPEPLEKIPESLLRAGRHEEALQWCERIMGQYTGNRQVTRMIERMKKEIVLSQEAKNREVTVQESTK